MPAASPGPTGVSPENSAIGAAPTASRTCPSPASDYEIMTARPRVTIVYCRQCNWLLRAGWLAQELLSTFAEEFGEVALIPGTGGSFEVEVDGEPLWGRRRDGGFPDLAALKVLLRDRIAPDRDLGHTDRSAAQRAGAA